MMTVEEIREAIERLPLSEVSELARWIEDKRPRQTTRSSPKKVGDSKNVRLPGDGSFKLEAVGESYYQEALEFICGGRSETGVDHLASARLIAEDTNRYDKLAVRVDVEGRTVGYLSKPDAKAYRDYIDINEGNDEATSECALIFFSTDSFRSLLISRAFDDRTG